MFHESRKWCIEQENTEIHGVLYWIIGCEGLQCVYVTRSEPNQRHVNTPRENTASRPWINNAFDFKLIF